LIDSLTDVLIHLIYSSSRRRCRCAKSEIGLPL